MKKTSMYDVTSSKTSVVVLSDTETYRFSRIDGSDELRVYAEDEYVPIAVKAALSEHGFRIPDEEVSWPIEYTSRSRTEDQESIEEHLFNEKAVPAEEVPDRFKIPELAVTYTIHKDGSLDIESVDW